jgi:hypothetical protein
MLSAKNMPKLNYDSISIGYDITRRAGGKQMRLFETFQVIHNETF